MVERSTLSFRFHSNADELSPIKVWGVKCRHCSKQIIVPAVICEKPKKSYGRACLQPRFICHDGTCVLAIYQCDFISDCWDGSDEKNCDMNVCDNCKNHFVTLPCLLGGLCHVSDVNIILTHSICDGIYSNATLSQKRYVCHKYPSKHINVSPLINNIVLELEYIREHFDNVNSVYDKEKEACSVSDGSNTGVE